MFESWEDGIFPEFRQYAATAITDDEVRLHDYVRAVNSSMVFTFNLFLPFRFRDYTPLEICLASATGRVIKIESAAFEYYGDCAVLGEYAGEVPSPSEKFTAADVGLTVRQQDGSRGIVLIEVKLSEGGFTDCGGRDSSANDRKDVCGNAAAFFQDPNSCYLRRPRHARKDRRYWKIFEAEYGDMKAAFPHVKQEVCPFAGDFQQIMRNHAMALGLVQAGHFDFCHFGLVHHDENLDVIRPWDQYCSTVCDSTPLFRLPASQLISAIEANGVWGEVAHFLRTRYMLRG